MAQGDTAPSPRYALFECPNGRSHRSKAEVLWDMGVESVATHVILPPECADCGARMEIRYYATQEDVWAGNGIDEKIGDSVETRLEKASGQLRYRVADLATAEEPTRTPKQEALFDARKAGVSLTYGSSSDQREGSEEWWDLVIDLGPTPEQQRHDLVAFGRIELLRQALGAYRSALLSGESESQEMRDLAKEALQ